MSGKIQAIRGMHDLLPSTTPAWRAMEGAILQVMARYGYEEIRFPIVEKAELFVRTIGEVTDIVEKEMYAFDDRNGDKLALRPEGTAACIRACIENGLLYNQVQRLWYMGPMFRHERPQKGRYRQFHQFGAEAYGMAGPDIDAEMIIMTARLWQVLGLEKLTLQLNSLGTSAIRASYRAVLVEYMSLHKADLDEDSVRRLDSNPLRILDSKNPAMKVINSAAPKLIDHLDDESRDDFERLCHYLDEAGVDYVVNPYLMRGLDYYDKTVFEWVSDELGAQGTVCAGGRYNGLVEKLGGKPTPAIGFAMGLDRLLSLIETLGLSNTPSALDAYMVIVGEGVQSQGLKLAEQIRDANKDYRIRINCSGGSFKSQMKKADQSGALLAFILGEDEVEKGEIGIKNLREKMPQETVSQSTLIDNIKQTI